MTEKRRRKRFARRIQVHFWQKGEGPRSGYTTNISTTGMFIATNSPLPPRSRFRIEVLGEEGFICEAVVAHAARVSPALQSIRSSGMGIRFIQVSELVRTLLPPVADNETEALEAYDDEPEHAIGTEHDEEGEAEADGADQPGAGEAEAKPRPEPEPEPEHAADDGVPTFPVDFRNVAYLLEAIENEIHFGGLFVPTESPPELHSIVSIELRLPIPINRSVRSSATVVQIVHEDGKHGMGVAFADPSALIHDLNAMIEKSRPSREE